MADCSGQSDFAGVTICARLFFFSLVSFAFIVDSPRFGPPVPGQVDMTSGSIPVGLPAHKDQMSQKGNNDEEKNPDEGPLWKLACDFLRQVTVK